MKFLSLFLILAVCSPICDAQTDTIRIATYNLLNYGNAANPVAYKNKRLQPILAEIKPTIQCFNEISTAKAGLLDTLLGTFSYPCEHGKVHNTVSTTQLDGLFWKQGKFHQLLDTIICSIVRDIVAYELYWDYPDLSTYHDTLKLTVITAHLKSSNAASDKADRASETQKVSDYLSSRNSRSNIIMLGDFNLYTSSEIAYQNLTNSSNPIARLNDPLSRPGGWDNNSSFADIHTQSPRLAALSDGGASGGLDSRFDFILMSDAVMDGSMGIKYLTNTYGAFGNDGQHYGKAITDAPTNSAVSPAIAQALYECSDHLPVYADVAFTPIHLLQPNTVVGYNQSWQDLIKFENPFRNEIHYHNQSWQTLKYYLLSIEGRVLQSGTMAPAASRIELESGMQQGLYLMRIETKDGRQLVYKLLKL